MAKRFSPVSGSSNWELENSHIKGYKTIAMEDVVYQPKGTSPLGDVMADDMVCTVTEGELQVTAGDMQFTAKEGDVWRVAARVARKRLLRTTEQWSQ